MHLEALNDAQRRAVEYGIGARDAGPLLIIAGAGSGKTSTLACRTAHLIAAGADPQRILLQAESPYYELAHQPPSEAQR